jgi:hypothetical protein
MNLLLLSGKTKVLRKLLNLFGRASIVEIWPLDERTGTVAYGVVNGYNGAYTGVDLANVASRVTGNFAPYFDGANDYVGIYSAGLEVAFNGAAGTILALSRNLGDATSRRVLTIGDGGSNRLLISNGTLTTVLQVQRLAGGASIARTLGSTLDTRWYLSGETWDEATDTLRGYLDGVQVGADINTIGTWATPLNQSGCYIGAISGPSTLWTGYISYVILLNRAATAAEMLQANKILGGA